jgi:hypothetical protein
VIVEPVFYRVPPPRQLRLPVRPQLASWDRARAPSQQRLAGYLEQTQQAVAPAIEGSSGPVALRLDVGLPTSVSLLDEHDLDNYLFPLTTALDRRERRIVSVWGHKFHGDDSHISIQPAQVATGAQDWAIVQEVVTTASSQTRAFKEQINQQLTGLDELPDGGITLEISYVVGPGRYWPNLWKATIDALDTVLGRTHPDRNWHPRDGRIDTLGLHCTVDPGIGNVVRITLRAAAATT